MNKLSWVNMNLVKRVGCIAVVGGSLLICFLGISMNAGQRQQQKIEYAEITIRNETEKIKFLDKLVGELYKDETEEFLVNPIEELQIKQLETKVNQLKTEAADFGLKSNHLPLDISQIAEDKQKLASKLADIRTKYTIQQQVQEMLVQAPENWEATGEAVIINEKATAENLLKLHNVVVQFNSVWSNGISVYLNEMDAQVNLYNEIQQGIAKMIDGQNLTSEATLEAFIHQFNQVSQVKNTTLRKRLSERLEQVDQLMNAQIIGEENLLEEPI